jgi:two-component system sensor histidine kinase UhpB
MKQAVKILIAEHDKVDLELLHFELEKIGFDYICETVKNEREFTQAIINFTPDVILSDFNFPTFSGMAAFNIRQQLASETPFIFVSGAIGEEKSVELIKIGVTDYVLKDKLFALNPKIARALKEYKEHQQKKKAEQKLAISEQRLSRAQQLAHLGSWALNNAASRLHLSEEAGCIYDIKPSLTGHSFETWLSFIHPEEKDLVYQKIQESRKSSQDFSVNCRIINKRGNVKHIYLEGKPEFDEDGKPTGLFGIVQDITQNVILENRLAKERSMRQREITAAVLSAQEKERASIGKELNNNLNHILSAIKLYIEMAKRDEANRQMLLEKSTIHIVKVIEKITMISKAVSHPDVYVGLINSIRILIDDMTTTEPVKFDLYDNDIDETLLDHRMQLTLFRIVQEQVNNIVNHAKASWATISLSREGSNIVLIITDNGRGTNTAKESKGVGIKNIKSRTELYNGKVAIESQPGKGYQLKVSLSLNGYLNKTELLEVSRPDGKAGEIHPKVNPEI